MGSKHMGPTWQGEKLTEELAIAMVIRRLRGILGTEELTAMRATIVSQALSSPGKGG
jgi:hypothetical protein